MIFSQNLRRCYSSYCTYSWSTAVRSTRARHHAFQMGFALISKATVLPRNSFPFLFIYLQLQDQSNLVLHSWNRMSFLQVTHSCSIMFSKKCFQWFPHLHIRKNSLPWFVFPFFSLLPSCSETELFLDCYCGKPNANGLCVSAWMRLDNFTAVPARREFTIIGSLENENSYPSRDFKYLKN